MRCKGCQYPLWKLSARACPECGAPFTPSDFDFRPETVKFCCPHCWQVYYGTDERGLIEPREFECVKCAKRIELDSMVLLPAEGFEAEHATEAEVVPWIERKTVGYWKALWRTMVMGAFTPGRLGDALTRDRTEKTGLFYALRLNFLFALVGGWLFILVPVGIGLGAVLTAGGMTRGAFAGIVGLILMLALTMIVILTGAILGLLLWAGVTHAMIVLTGPSQGTYRNTLRGLTFTSGANLMQGIPCLGGYFSLVSWIWWAISGGLCIAKTHRVSKARAISATMAFPGVLFVAAASLLIFWGIPAFFGMIRQAQAAAQQAAAQAGQTTATARTKALVQLLVTEAEKNAAVLPVHAAVLVMDRRAFPTEFVVSGGGGGPEPLVSGFPLSQLSKLTAEDATQLKADLKVLVAPTGEHRVGDFVLCYQGAWKPGRGIGVVMPVDMGLWVAICDPVNPFMMGMPGQPTTGFGGIAVALADGVNVTWIADADIPGVLDAQNALRVSLGLAPLQWTPALTAIPGTPADTEDPVAAPEPVPASAPSGP